MKYSERGAWSGVVTVLLFVVLGCESTPPGKVVYENQPECVPMAPKEMAAIVKSRILDGSTWRLSIHRWRNPHVSIVLDSELSTIITLRLVENACRIRPVGGSRDESFVSLSCNNTQMLCFSNLIRWECDGVWYCSEIRGLCDAITTLVHSTASDEDLVNIAVRELRSAFGPEDDKRVHPDADVVFSGEDIMPESEVIKVLDGLSGWSECEVVFQDASGVRQRVGVPPDLSASIKKRLGRPASVENGRLGRPKADFFLLVGGDAGCRIVLGTKDWSSPYLGFVVAETGGKLYSWQIRGMHDVFEEVRALGPGADASKVALDGLARVFNRPVE